MALCTAANIPQTSIVSFVAVFPDVFDSPKATLSCLQSWEKLSGAGLSIEQVGYVLHGDEALLQPRAVLDLAATKASRSINSGLFAVQQKLPAADPAELTTELVKQFAAKTFPDKLLRDIIELTGNDYAFRFESTRWSQQFFHRG